MYDSTGTIVHPVPNGRTWDAVAIAVILESNVEWSEKKDCIIIYPFSAQFGALYKKLAKSSKHLVVEDIFGYFFSLP